MMNKSILSLEGRELNEAVHQIVNPSAPFNENKHNYAENPALFMDLMHRFAIDLHKVVVRPMILEADHFNPSKGDKLQYLEAYKRKMTVRPVSEQPDNPWLAKISDPSMATLRWSKDDCPSTTALIAVCRALVKEYGDQ